VEVVLVPEVDLVDLLHVQRLVLEGGDVKITARGKHFATYKEVISVSFKPAKKVYGVY
jgi:hypothetical protein